MPSPSAFDLAARQIELDRAATAQIPVLFDRKRARRLASPHALLRGSAPLFYELLAAHPELAAGPEGTGWVVGDMHLENVGAFRTDDDTIVFDLNDFDDGTIAPLRFDVLRVTTSVLLAARSFRCTGGDAITMAERLLASYVRAAFEAGSDAPPTPEPVAELIHGASARSQKQLLDDRAPADKGKRRFVRGERYMDVAPDLRAALDGMLKEYVHALGPRAPAHSSEWQIEDAAFRVAGTGSLGSQRVAVLVREKNGDNRLLEFKEARPSSVENAKLGERAELALVKTPAARVVAAARALLHDPARHLAALSGAGTSFIARKLFPQEDKLGIDRFKVGPRLDSVVQTIGYLLGRAHMREGAVLERPRAAWTQADTGAILDHAIEIAGVFEAVYLAYARWKP